MRNRVREQRTQRGLSQAELAAAVRQATGERPGRAYWHIQAPLDWDLEPRDGRL